MQVEKEEGQEESAVEDAEEQLDDEDDAFLKMKHQAIRYFIEGNPTLKCRNCL